MPDYHVASQDNAPDELPDKLEIAKDLDHKVFAWKESYISLLAEIKPQINQLQQKGKELKAIFSASSIPPTKLRKIRILLQSIDETCKALQSQINLVDGTIEGISKISKKCSEIIGTQKYVMGMEGFWSPEGSVDHVSNSDLVKKTFYFFREKELLELVALMKPYLQESHSSLDDAQNIPIKTLLDSLIMTLIPFLRSELAYIPFLEKTLLLQKWEDISTKIAKWVSPFTLLNTQNYFAGQIAKAKEGYELLTQTKEYSLNAAVKLEGFWGTKKEVQAILDLANALLG